MQSDINKNSSPMPFADIDMLELPESETLMSQTESISNSPEPAPRAKTYPTLRQWLGGAELEFQFDADQHRRSARHADDVSHAEAEHVSRMYKVVEELATTGPSFGPSFGSSTGPSAGSSTGSSSGPSSTNDNGGGFDSPVGVVTSASRADDGRALNAAFSRVVESTDQYVEACSLVVDDATAADHRDLAALLDAVHAHLFSRGDPQRTDHIVRWINRYDPKPDNAVVDEVMYNTPVPYTHAKFWGYIGDLVTRGMFAAAVLSLRASKYEERPERALVEDLATLLDAYQGMALKGQFAQWKLAVVELRDSVGERARDFGAQQKDETDNAPTGLVSAIHDLLRILSGLPKTIAAHTDAWYDMYAALALYQVRDASDADYALWFRLAVAEKGSDPALAVEQAFGDLMRGHYLRVVLALDRLDPPTAAYVCKLMEWRGCFADYYRDLAASGTITSRTVSDYLLTRHAYECFESHALVPVAAGLVVEVVKSADARAVLAQFLPHYVCFTNDDMEWALTLCTKLHLTETANAMYVRQGEQLLRQGHVYEALTMFVRSGSAAAMDHIHTVAWDLFQDLLLNCTPVPDELLGNIVANRVDAAFEIHPVIRQCLAPYAVLAEYLADMQKPLLFAKNLSRLFHLLQFKYMPRKFAPLLLAQLLPMFADGPFRLPDLIVVIELLDTFDRRLAEDPDADVEELYLYAVENPPAVEHDWRAVLKSQDTPIPPTVGTLVRELREHIVAQIGKVYVGTCTV